VVGESPGRVGSATGYSMISNYMPDNINKQKSASCLGHLLTEGPFIALAKQISKWYPHVILFT
jgi:hypothetical protein